MNDWLRKLKRNKNFVQNLKRAYPYQLFKQ